MGLSSIFTEALSHTLRNPQQNLTPQAETAPHTPFQPWRCQPWEADCRPLLSGVEETLAGDNPTPGPWQIWSKRKGPGLGSRDLGLNPVCATPQLVC